MKIRCLIVDDEQYARKLLADYIIKLPALELIAQCRNSMEAMHWLHNDKIDLMFLDIQMPDLTGIELLKSLSSKPVIIFTTAFSEYAVEGYQLDVIDYMVKPIAFERFVQGVNKAIEYINLQARAKNKMPDSETNRDEFINIKADYKIYKVRIDDILYIEGLREYVSFYTSERRYIVLESLKKLETLLPQGQFMRVHKSYIVNTQKIDSLHGNTIEIGKIEIPIGMSYASEVKEKLFGVQSKKQEG
ncbi:MAG: LytR/AlgR family response regulator transcription factor [Bacteroidales bacterium]